MRIQHNITAMNAYRNYNTNTSAVSKNLEKLSSGYRINRAGDDAAGLAISEKMRAQITGLATAQKNAKDGISLVQTGEGALTEVHSMLNRMVELSNQAANGTYDNNVDRANLQKEVDSLRSEIDRIADSTNFNGINLLDGSMAVTGGASDLSAAFDPLQKPGLEDGVKAPAATKAEITIDKNAGTFTINGQTLTPGKIDTTNISSITVNLGGGKTGKISDFYDVKEVGDTIVLTAKTAGALSTIALDEFENAAGVLDVKNGTNEGGATDATKAKYELTFDISKIQGGQSFKIGGQDFVFITDGITSTLPLNAISIDLTGLNLTSKEGQAAAADILGGVFKGVGSGGSIALAGTTSGVTFGIKGTADSTALQNGKLTIRITASTTGEAGNAGGIRVSSGNSAVSGKYTAGLEKSDGVKAKYAEVSYDIDLNALKVGDQIKVGDKTVTIIDDNKETENKKDGKISLATAQDANKLQSVFEQMGYPASKLKITSNKITIIDTVAGNKAEAFARKPEAQFSIKSSTNGQSAATGGLTLQIGDTSDDFNQLNVAIEDMHAQALGIDAINITSQEGAKAAVDVIKEAINKVSSTRGTLGATQNRLEHTINNLSVAEENIQNAESAIRDTDVAKEMMAYTKNNILVQSAQAMLAQANQTPQGVLQLLQ